MDPILQPIPPGEFLTMVIGVKSDLTLKMLASTDPNPVPNDPKRIDISRIFRQYSRTPLAGLPDCKLSELIRPQAEFGLFQRIIAIAESGVDPVHLLRELRWVIGRNALHVFVVPRNSPKFIYGYFEGLERDPVERTFADGEKWIGNYETDRWSSVHQFYRHLVWQSNDRLDKDLSSGAQISTPGDRRLAAPDVPEAIVTELLDTPGQIAIIAQIVAGLGINVVGFIVRRERQKQDEAPRAILVTLLDRVLPESGMVSLRSLGVRPRRWMWQNREDLDLSEFPISIPHSFNVLKVVSDDRPGRIARMATRLSDMGINVAAFLVYRPMNRILDYSGEQGRSRMVAIGTREGDQSSTILCITHDFPIESKGGKFQIVDKHFAEDDDNYNIEAKTYLEVLSKISDRLARYMSLPSERVGICTQADIASKLRTIGEMRPPAPGQTGT